MNERPTSFSFPRGAQTERSEEQARHDVSMLDAIRNGVAAQGRLGQGAGFSDDDLAAEYTAQKLVRKAVEDFKAAIEAANELSALTQIRANAFNDFVHDEITPENIWDERISDARRG